jgi:NADH-quinone oxidoreductase subunit A
VDQYLPIVTLLVLATAFAGLSFLVSAFLAPQKPTKAKLAPYECGILPSREPLQRFPVRFYLVAMIFIIFDIEIIFLYPWAVIFRQLYSFGLAEMVVFAFAVFVSFLYLISNGALDWGPVRRIARVAPPRGVSSLRTTTSTVRRVSRPNVLEAGEEAEPVEEPAVAPAAASPAPVASGPDAA